MDCLYGNGHVSFNNKPLVLLIGISLQKCTLQQVTIVMFFLDIHIQTSTEASSHQVRCQPSCQVRWGYIGIY